MLICYPPQPPGLSDIALDIKENNVIPVQNMPQVQNHIIAISRIAAPAKEISSISATLVASQRAKLRSNTNPAQNKYQRWYRVVLIICIILAILLSLVFLFGVITEKDGMVYDVIHKGPIKGRIMVCGVVLFFLFDIIGIPTLAFLSCGLHSENKTLKYLLYCVSGGWLAGWVILFVLLIFR